MRCPLISTGELRKGRAVDVSDFVARYPRLYHVAHGDAWSGLQRYGLLSASALVRLFEVADADSLLAERRLGPKPIKHSTVSGVLRSAALDQQALTLSA